MFTDQELQLENIRFLAKLGGDTEFYDALRVKLIELAETWGQMELSADERVGLEENRRRLVFELGHYRNLASVAAG